MFASGLYTRTMRPSFLPAATLALSLSAVACTGGPFVQAQRSIDDGSARAALQAQLDAKRQCAPVLDSVDPPLEDLDASRPPIRALLSAGLVQPSRASNGRRTFSPTPLGRADFVYETTSGARGQRLVTLCYGRRRVDRVWLRPHDRTDPLPFTSYTYRVDRSSAWAAHQDFRAAFPFLAEAFSRESTDNDSVFFFDDGRWKFDDLDERILGMSAQNSFLISERHSHGG